MCDASGAVPIDEHHFLVVSDEDSILRVYDTRVGGAPVAEVDLTDRIAIAIEPRERPPRRGRIEKRPFPRAPKSPRETDIEAATRLDNHGYFVASHTRSGGPKSHEARYLLFATTLGTNADAIKIVGSPYRQLLQDLIEFPPLKDFELSRAASIPAPDDAALNIEALTTVPDKTTWIGFRSPTFQGKALLVSLKNLSRLPFGERAVFGEVKLLDLDGFGLRGLTYTNGRLLIAAGPAGSGRATKIFHYNGEGKPVVENVSLPQEFNPEGFFDPYDRYPVMLLSDDGNRLVDGIECKKLTHEQSRGFRGLWFGHP
jgi:hypothetical protein